MLEELGGITELPDDLVRGLLGMPEGRLITIRKDCKPEPGRPLWQIVCDHLQSKKFTYLANIPTDEPLYSLVDLRPAVLKFNMGNHLIYIGRCTSCGICYWCNT